MVINSSLTANILPTYSVQIIPALRWNQTSSGNWKALDRGSSCDIHQAEVTFLNTYSEIKSLSLYLDDRRGDITVTLGRGEEIFGPHIDYGVGAISATVVEYGEIKRINSKLFAFPIKLQAINVSTNPNVSGTNLTGSLLSIRQVIGEEMDRSWLTTKMDSYTGAFTYINHGSDSGTAKLFIRSFGNPISASPIAQVVKGLLVTRGSAINFPIGWGETEPFGPRQEISIPTVKITEWKLAPRESLTYWDMQLTLRENHS